MRPKSKKTSVVYPQLWLIHVLLWPHKAQWWGNYKPLLYELLARLRFLSVVTQEADLWWLVGLGQVRLFSRFFHFFPIFFLILCFFFFNFSYLYFYFFSFYLPFLIFKIYFVTFIVISQFFNLFCFIAIFTLFLNSFLILKSPGLRLCSHLCQQGVPYWQLHTTERHWQGILC